jgi:hypothetical protein
MITFRNEIEQEQSSDNPAFFLKVDLFFLEATDQEIKNPKIIPNEVDDEKIKKFEIVQSRIFQINTLVKGLFEL